MINTEYEIIYKSAYQQGYSDAVRDFRKLSKTDAIDLIRAEIEKGVWEDVIVSLDGTDETRIPRLDPDDVFEIIDKYKAEREESK